MKTQYIIQEKSYQKREEIIDYNFKHYEIKNVHFQNRQYMIESTISTS